MTLLTSLFSSDECRVIRELAEEKDLSEVGVLRQALRLYQMVARRLAEGETMHFSGDAARQREFFRHTHLSSDGDSPHELI